MEQQSTKIDLFSENYGELIAKSRDSNLASRSDESNPLSHLSDSGYFDQSQSMYGILPQSGQTGPKNENNSNVYGHSDHLWLDQDDSQHPKSFTTNFPGPDQSEIYGNGFTTDVYGRGDPMEGYDRNYELEPNYFGHRAEPTSFDSTFSDFDKSINLNHSSYRSFGESDIEDNDHTHKLKVPKNDNRTPSPSLPQNLFKPDFLNLNSPKTLSPVESPIEAASQGFNLSQSISASFAKSSLHAVMTNRPVNVVLDLDETDGIESHFRQKSHYLPNAYHVMVNNKKEKNKRNLSESQCTSGNSHLDQIISMEKLERKPWYDGLITKEEASNLLCEKKKEGCFIVRKGTKSAFSLTFYTTCFDENGEAAHISIAFDENCRKWKLGADGLRQKPTFDCLSDLVDHGIKNGIKMENGHYVKLKKPLRTRRPSKSVFEKIKTGRH